MNSKQGEIFVSSFLLYLVRDLNYNRAGISRKNQILIEKKSGYWEIKLDISLKKWALGNKTGHSYMREWTLSSNVNVNIKMYKSDKIKMYNHSKLT